MYPTADLCRIQQAYHRERAETSLLENVRIVANKAAIAWGIEADAAEDREARRVRTRSTADLIAMQRQQAGIEMLVDADENADLGRAMDAARREDRASFALQGRPRK